MKTTVQRDDPAILANSAQLVHLAFQFIAPGDSGHRPRPCRSPRFSAERPCCRSFGCLSLVELLGTISSPQLKSAGNPRRTPHMNTTDRSVCAYRRRGGGPLRRWVGDHNLVWGRIERDRPDRSRAWPNHSLIRQGIVPESARSPVPCRAQVLGLLLAPGRRRRMQAASQIL